MSVELQERTASQASSEQELTDGFHLLIDALKMNGLNTIYGCLLYTSPSPRD